MAQARILVVEDERIIALDIKKCLEGLGYSVPALAASGAEAVQRAAETRPDLVLMDIQLKKGMDGIAAARQIRMRFDIPVVYLTSYADEATLERAKLAEPFGYLLKPFAQRELHTTLETALYKHHMERQVKESEERFRNVFENSPMGIYRTTPDGHILMANPVLVCMLGYSSAEELLRRDLENEGFHPGHTRSEFKQRIEHEGQIAGLESAWLRKDGSTLWVRENAKAIRQNGDILYYEGTVEDITQRKRVLDELTTLNQIIQATNSTLDLQEILTIITDHATRLLDTPAASVILRDQARGDLWFAAASGAGAEFIQGQRMAIGQGIAGWVVQHGQPVLVPDVAQDERFYADFDTQSGFTSRSILCVPLRARGRVTGAIEAMNKEGSPFDQEDLRLLSSLAEPAATAIENARLHAETQRRAEQLAVLHELDRAITASLHITEVYYALARHARRLLPYDHLSIALIEADEVRLAYVADAASAGRLAASRSPARQPAACPQQSSLQPPDRVAALGTALPLKTSSVGWVAAMGQPLLRHHIAADAHFSGDELFMASGIQAAMIVPLRVKGQVIGTCNIASRQVGAYTPDDLIIAQFMADQLAIAIQNAHLFQQVHVERERLQTLSRQLVEVQEIERRHIARELHDEAGQALTSLMVGLRLVEEEGQHGRVTASRIAELKRTADSVLENLHQLASDLRPASLDHLGLAEALRQYTETFSCQHNLTVQLETVGFEHQRLSPTAETALYRIVQEALTNVARHAQASRVGVLLECRGERLVVIVEDDGLGCDPQAALQSGRLGLLGIRERAEMLGGSLEMESSPGAGTTLFVEVPYVHSHPDRR
jgi:PAS domain S-box-containing protein